jgi:uncharacterized UPF0160 family protein
MKIVTHNNYFHSDDLFAVGLLLMKYPEAEVVRSRDEEVINSADIVVDVGQVYDPAKRRFDHHQKEGGGSRENGIPYASFGLVWKEYGVELSGGEEEASVVDRKLVAPIDALDNGVDIYKSNYEGVKPYDIGDYLDVFLEGAQSTEDFEKDFSQALLVAQDVLNREITRARRQVGDWKEIRKIYEEATDKRIIVLAVNKSWKEVLVSSQAIYVVFPRPDGQWSARAIPRAHGSYELKKPMPQLWAGLKDEQLAQVSGVSDATFCHRDLWLANARSQEGALKLAQIALEAK